MPMIAGLLGALCAVGAVTFVVAMRPVAPGGVRGRRRQQTSAAAATLSTRVENLTLRLVLGLAAAVVMGALTRWPMAALLCGIAGFMAPSLMGGAAARKARLERIEAIAGWAEMLRDTMAGSGGLEQSIIATAGVAPVPLRRPRGGRPGARRRQEPQAPGRPPRPAGPLRPRRGQHAVADRVEPGPHP